MFINSHRMNLFLLAFKIKVHVRVVIDYHVLAEVCRLTESPNLFAFLTLCKLMRSGFRVMIFNVRDELVNQLISYSNTKAQRHFSIFHHQWVLLLHLSWNILLWDANIEVPLEDCSFLYHLCLNKLLNKVVCFLNVVSYNIF